VTNYAVRKSNIHASRWILWGIPVIIAAAGIMHFVYEWSGKLVPAGVFAPVNESVWEHLKMTFWPALIWCITGYVNISKKERLSPSQWFFSCTTAQLIYPLVIVSFYYAYTGALGIESLFLDILSLFLGVIFGQLLALHIYNYAKTNRLHLYFSILVLILLAAAFTVFTFAPPRIPIFRDPLTGSYGIE